SIVSGTVDIGNHCWNCTTWITLPFGFRLYDQTFTTANVDSKGTLQFDSNLSNGNNTCLPGASYSYTIFAEWDNYRTDYTDEGVFTSISGSAPNRIFNIEWRTAQIGEGGLINFEIRLYENSPEGRFDLVYGSSGNREGLDATVGVQKDATHLTQFECETGGLRSGLALIFAQPVCGTATTTPTP